MWRTHVSRVIGAPADVVFDVLTDLSAWPVWGPSVRSATIEAPPLRAGSRGTVTTSVGVRLPFVVTSYADGRSWSWSVAGVPATDHLVEPLGPRRSRLTFGTPWPATPYLAVCAIALRRIERIALSRGSPPP